MRWWIAVTVAVALAACEDVPVRTERADAPGGGPVTSGSSIDEAPVTSEREANEPDEGTTGPLGEPSTTIVPGTGTRAAATSTGDALFPALGSSDVDVVTYDVVLDVDVDAGLLRGVNTVEARVDRAATTFPLDAVGLDVDAVEVDGEPASFVVGDEELVVDLPADRAEIVRARIEYSVAPTPSSAAGLPTGWFGGADGTSFVPNEPDGSRTWMPSNDHPSDKAAWRFEITVPDGVTAVANGELVSGGDGAPWIWAESEPMPTYLVQLVVGDYDIVEADPVTTIDGRRIPVTHVVPAGERTTYEPFFDSVQEQLAFFEERFGPYPLERYGLAFVDGLAGIAMETLGRSMFGAADFAGGDRYGHELLLAHELAHQWFGNAVSPADWGDIWLNESPTTYAQWLWLDEIGVQPLESEAAAQLARRQQPLGSTAETTVEDMFGYLRYDGGAVVVHALRTELGDEMFFEVMSSWVARHDGSSRTTDDFITHAETVGERDLDDFFVAWLFADLLPAEFPS